MTRIKICGITEERDAIEAVHLGVDAIGFVFWKGSPRYIAPREAGRIISKLPPFLTKVGVFVDEAANVVMDAVYASGITALQFHGREAPDYCRQFQVSWFKAFRLEPGFDPIRLSDYSCTTYLLDGPAGDARGGAGQVGDWRVATAAQRFGRIILAGGLTPENVASAIRVARPYAIDASSGVEVVPGKKNIDRIEQLVTAVKHADAAIQREENAS